MKPVFTPGGWHVEFCVLKCFSRFNVCACPVLIHFSNHSPLKTVVSKNVTFLSDISAVNFIVGW